MNSSVQKPIAMNKKTVFTIIGILAIAASVFLFMAMGFCTEEFI